MTEKSWDDEDYEPTIPGASSSANDEGPDSWEDVDVNTLKIKGKWDEEDEEVKKPAPPRGKAAEAKPKPAAPKKPAPTTYSTSVAQSDDPQANRERQLRLQQASDYENLTDLLGIKDKPLSNTFEVNLPTPKNEIEFEQFANELAKRLTVFESNFSYRFFVKTLTKQLCSPLTKVEEIKEIISTLELIVSDRQKLEKQKQEKAKQDKAKEDKAKPAAGKPAAKKKVIGGGATTGKKGFKDYDDLDIAMGRGDFSEEEDEDDFM